jgi:hypothetical protein
VSSRISEDAEILVLSKQRAGLRSREHEHVLVRGSRADFGDHGNVVTSGAESDDCSKVATLVGEESQRLFPCSCRVLVNEDDLFVREGVGGITHCRVNVVAGQAGIRLEQIGLGGTLAQLAKQQFNGDARPANDGLAEHHVRIDWIEFAVTRALARTWWGDMTTAADVQGASLLTDALPIYEGLCVIDARHGAEQVTRYLRTATDDYLKQRALDDAAEPALVQADGQAYLPLRGAMAFWAADAMLGHARMAQALHRFWAEHARREPPFAGAARLIEMLTDGAESGKRQRIVALFTNARLKVDADGTFRDPDPASAGDPVHAVTSR